MGECVTMYLLLTREQELLAKGILESGTPEGIMQMRIAEGSAQEVAEQEVICVFGSDAGETPMQCKVTERKGSRVLLKKIMTLNPELRRSYRIPADFCSYLYPVSGQWRGRKSLKAVDLSCGGIAFYTTDGLEVGEIAEVIIPIIRLPVIVRVKILRKEILADGRVYYGCSFKYQCRQEEESVCQAVFGIQIEHRKNGTAKNYTI